jgi:hypothetical protein
MKQYAGICKHGTWMQKYAIPLLTVTGIGTDDGTMRKRSSRDVNTMAAKVIAEVLKKTEAPPLPKKKRKNPAAVALGRLGGLKGGAARAEMLTAAERSDIARRAAQARWQKAKE